MALTGKTILQLDHYTSSLTGNEAFPIEYSGSTYHISQSQIISGLATTGSNTFVGNQIISGSITVSGSGVNDLTASYAISASYAFQSTNADTASYVENAETASYVLNAISASYASSSTSASYASASTSASYAETASYAPNYLPIADTASMLAPYALISQVSPSVGAGNLFNYYNFT